MIHAVGATLRQRTGRAFRCTHQPGEAHEDSIRAAGYGLRFDGGRSGYDNRASGGCDLLIWWNFGRCFRRALVVSWGLVHRLVHV